ncbi:hypothetical protein O181_076161 [Austropuccinia psidii MF-1]|uniref:Uncharacterized protein n=1 Tax=Austropuccinia psidii MF-1 TaxID=1389203 RepID=A0A9Q3F9V1_9BASI|nr:hypothetical protein [Austropuccinia psidii MF-1]
MPSFLFDSVEKNLITLETQSQGSTPVIPAESEVSKGKGKRHSEALMTTKKWTPIATQRSRKPQNCASIKGKQILISCTGKITIINPVVTSKRKLPKSVDNKFVQGTVKETLAFKGTSQRTEKACPEPEDLEEDTLDTVVDGKTLRKIIPNLQFTFQFNRNLKRDDWEDMGQVLQLHQLLEDLLNGERTTRDLKDLMVITKGCNPTRKFRLLEVRENRIRENEATIQAIEEQLNQIGPTLIPSGSQGVDQTSSPVASHH